MIGGVDLDNSKRNLIAFLENFFGMLDTLVADFGNMDQSFERIVEFRERAELGQPGNNPFNELSNLIFRDLTEPGIVLRLANRKTDPVLLLINADNLDLDLLSDLKDVGGFPDMIPGNFGKMDKAVHHSVNINECAEIGEAGDAAGQDFA